MTEQAGHAPVYEEKQEPTVMLSPHGAHYLLGLSSVDREDSIGKALTEVALGQASESLAAAYVRTAEYPVLSDNIMDQIAALAPAEDTV